MEADSLIKCTIVKKGEKSSETYQVGENILISADKVRKIKHPDCPKDIFVVYNEDLIFCKLKE